MCQIEEEELTDTIVKLDGYYMEWSTVVEAPVTYGALKNEFIANYRWSHEEWENSTLLSRLNITDKTGCSTPGITADELIANNRAGQQEECLTRAEIVEQYCTNYKEYDLRQDEWLD